MATGIEVRTGNKARCVYCPEPISAKEERVVISNGPRQYNFARSAHIGCFIRNNNKAIVRLTYEMGLIGKSRLDAILTDWGALQQ